MTHTREIHLLVAVHGMWGNPSHLTEVARTILEKYIEEGGAVRLEVLVAQTNTESATYDGIDWGGERVAEEVSKRIEELEFTGEEKVTRFSVVGYSLGGLLSRYLVGILNSRKFFDTVQPVNFTTFATPHIGLPVYPNFFSRISRSLGPRLLSRTGAQFYLADDWDGRGRGLVEVLADPEGIFIEGLKKFEKISIYGSAFNDRTVPYVTALIEPEDPFMDYETEGLVIELDKKYSAIITSHSSPSRPPSPTQAGKSKKGFRIRLPPVLQWNFPYNILVYALLPLLIPLGISVALVKVTMDSSKSKKRIQLLEKEKNNAEAGTMTLADMLRRMEKGVEDTVAEMIDNPGEGTSTLNEGITVRASSPSSTTSAKPKSKISLCRTKSSSKTTTTKEEEGPSAKKGNQPLITPTQHKLIKDLNAHLPQMTKHTAYFPDVMNAHAIIVCRDVKRFEIHKRGESVLQHWADRFEF